MLLFVLNGPFGNDRYIYDLNVPKWALCLWTMGHPRVSVNASGFSLWNFEMSETHVLLRGVCVCGRACVCAGAFLFARKTCSTEFPSCNQVGGSRLVVNTCEGVIGPNFDW